jgi:AAA domain-containing protein
VTDENKNEDGLTDADLDEQQIAEIAWALIREHFEEPDKGLRNLKDIRWLIEDVWPASSHGMIGGGEKSFKSFLALQIAVCVAADRKLFDRYAVSQGPVVVFNGEGTNDLFWRRLLRVAGGMGMSREEIDRLPIHVTDETPAVTEPLFKGMLAATLHQIKPALVIIDPFYAYHGADTDGGNIYKEGERLNMVSQITKEADRDCALMIVHHFNKASTRDGALSTASLTMAGGREWCDSWMLVRKRSEPDFDSERKVELEARVGTRQDEIGHHWSLQLHLDERRKRDDGSITYDGRLWWEVGQAVAGTSTSGDVITATREAVESSEHGLTLSEARTGCREKNPGLKFNNEDYSTMITSALLTTFKVVKRKRAGKRQTSEVIILKDEELLTDDVLVAQPTWYKTSLSSTD